MPQQTAGIGDTSLAAHHQTSAITMNDRLLPAAQAVGTWFAVNASKVKQQQTAAQQQEAHQQQSTTSPTADQRQRTSRLQRIFQQQMQAHDEIAAMRAAGGQARSRSLPRALESQFTYPAGSMAAAVAIAGPHNLRPLVPSTHLPAAVSVPVSSPPRVATKGV